MPIKLTKKDERYSYSYAGSTIFYRRIGKMRFNFFQKKHTRRGIVDWNAVTDDVLREYVLGWDNILGEDDQPVAFDPDLIQDLPIIVQNDLLDQISGEEGQSGEETAEKNSKASSSGK